MGCTHGVACIGTSNGWHQLTCNKQMMNCHTYQSIIKHKYDGLLFRKDWKRPVISLSET